jgi:hypothetical protein
MIVQQISTSAIFRRLHTTSALGTLTQSGNEVRPRVRGREGFRPVVSAGRGTRSLDSKLRLRGLDAPFIGASRP